MHYGSLVPFLAIAGHLGTPVEAFASAMKQQNLFPSVYTRTSHYPQPHSSKLVGRRHRVQRTYKLRTANRTHKFFVASSTGRALYNASGSENILSRRNKDKQEEDYPWECIIDPTYCDKCLDYHQLSQQYDFGTWFKKEEPDDMVTLTDKVSMTVTATTVIVSFALLLKLSGPGAWRFFLAGGLCAAASHAIPTPIDVVKVRYHPQ